MEKFQRLSLSLSFPSVVDLQAGTEKVLFLSPLWAGDGSGWLSAHHRALFIGGLYGRKAPCTQLVFVYC